MATKVKKRSFGGLGEQYARNKLIVMAVIGAIAAVISGVVGAWRYAPLIGWDAAAITFCASVWLSVMGMDAAETKDHAKREDPTHASTDLLLIAASIASLVAVGVVLIAASSASGSRQGLLAGLAVASVGLSWFLVHTMFTLRYARLFYENDSGVDFNEDTPPRYVDFAYLAFTIGMTFQVSDTNLTKYSVRSAALRHALLSYLLGAIVLATTINFIVSLSSSSS